MAKIKNITLADLVINNELQARVQMDESTIKNYTELYSELLEWKLGGEKGERPVKFPRVKVYRAKDLEGVQYYLVDGFHRVEAMKRSGWFEHFPVSVEITHSGNFSDAKWMSLGVNSQHGLSMSRADKRKATLTALEDEAFAEFSNRKIAKHIGVSHAYVNKMRKELEAQKANPAPDHADIPETNESEARKQEAPKADEPKPETAQEAPADAQEPEATEAADPEATEAADPEEVKQLTTELDELRAQLARRDETIEAILKFATSSARGRKRAFVEASNLAHPDKGGTDALQALVNAIYAR